MAKFVVLMNWTDQGVKNAKDTTQRAGQAREAFRQLGVELESVYWTIGAYDIVGVLSAPDAESVTAALLRLAGGGNVRSTTLQAFDEREMGSILSKIG